MLQEDRFLSEYTFEVINGLKLFKQEGYAIYRQISSGLSE